MCWVVYKNTAFAFDKTLRHIGCSIFTWHLWWFESFVLKHKSTTSQYSQTWVNDHIRITTNCLQRPPFLGSLCNNHYKKLPLDNDHLTTTTTGLTVHTAYPMYNDASDEYNDHPRQRPPSRLQDCGHYWPAVRCSEVLCTLNVEYGMPKSW